MPGANSTSQRSSRRSPLRAAVSGLACLAVAGTAVAGLAVGAVHGVRGTTALSTDRRVATWTLDNRYWACLDTQARSLIDPGARVWLDTTNFGTTIALEKLLAPWAFIVSSPGQASAYLTLRTKPGPGSCLGSVVVGRFPGPRGPGSVVKV
ncbi:MAG TPA: hypothetical protein VHZ02_07970, partial [Acidimicrobiales bacterium]|nr:hypothetical protein [Acidimicrobiales bacterium]